jgi:type II secretory pathway predicted ATPase ExeA/outer membrane protein OmpA-like peptidoglycan-associated protein
MSTVGPSKKVEDQILDYFGLAKSPFGVTPDPQFLFLSPTHREALASLISGIECGFGFQVLAAQPGMGKTTLLFSILERYRTSARTAFLFQQQYTPCELLQSVLRELGSSSNASPQSFAQMGEEFQQLLLDAAAAGQRVILVVDEAQNISNSILETLRQLSNFESSRAKLLQIILAGQPALVTTLASREQQQLRQRISMIARMTPLAMAETRDYVRHRLVTAGCRSDLFTDGALQRVWSNSGGIPRNINTLCMNVMLLAFSQRFRRIDHFLIDDAAKDFDLDRVRSELFANRVPPDPVREHALAGQQPPVVVVENKPPQQPPTDHPAPASLALPRSSSAIRGAITQVLLVVLLTAFVVAATQTGPLWNALRLNSRVVNAQSGSGELAVAGQLSTSEANEVSLQHVTDPSTPRLSRLAELSTEALSTKLIFFDVGDTTISGQNRNTLAAVAQNLRDHPDANVIIEGHADNSGDEEYNLDLSVRRALAVKDALRIEYGIRPNRLQTVGTGSSLPIESNGTSGGRAANRSVALRMTTQAGTQ